MVRRLSLPALFAATALLAVTGYWLLFTVFMAYDDEGYVLISLANYSAHGGLYAKVYSQYGPFFYVLHDALHRVLGYEFTSTTGRLCTLGCWLLAAGGAAQLVWRQTRDAALAAFALGLTFFHLWLMVSEPMHPGGLIVALVTLAAWLGARQIESQSMRGLAVTAGLVGAALLLTKVNVGVFFLAAAGVWFAANLKPAAPARRLTLLGLALLVLLPLVLMRAQLGGVWGRNFAELSAVASLGMLGVAWRDRQPLTAWRDAWWGAGALASLGAVIVAVVCLRGTPLRELLEGVLLGPLRHPGVYHFAPVWLPGAALAGGVSLLLAALVGNGLGPRLNWLLIALRLALILIYSLACLECLSFSAYKFTMSFAVPLAWIFALRLAPAGKANHIPSATTWLGLLLVLQYLHAFPVAGSQVAWGTFLIVPLLALGLHDTQRFIAARGRADLAAILGLVALGLAVGVTGRLVSLGWNRYAESRPLQLPGAADLRLPENFASTLRVISANASAQGDMLFTLPGLNSFHGWTGLPAPTLANTTHWFSLLTKAQQEEISAALDRSEHPVLIVQRGLLNFLAENNFSVESPLKTYLLANFARAFSLEQYEFWVRRDRVIVPLGTAEQLQLAYPRPGEPPVKLELIVTLPARGRIARIELATLDPVPSILAHWDKSTGSLSATALDLRDLAVTVPIVSAWDHPLPPVVRLSLPLTQQLMFDRKNAVIYVRDAGGAVLAEARFTD
ncbi:MAG: hypothetical protein PSU94_04505 [Lacunisphaera sp.]|nr:hypothetical protein [Lacunisphaera sp.]